MVDTGFSSPGFSSSLRHGDGRSPDTPESTLISARFSSRNILTVHLAADRLLSDCWTKACEFARNFNALHIDIDHLLLGASHVRDAESALSVACDDIEELTHELARLCARRSFAEAPEDNEAYEASQTLRIILCEASALAARQGVPNLTLSLVIEALAKTEPKPAVIDVLPKLRRQIEAEEAQEAEAMALLNSVSGKIDELNMVFDAQLRAKLGALDSYVAQAVAQNLGPIEERLQQSIGQRIEQVAQLTHKKSDETRHEVYEAIRILPGKIANLVGERVATYEPQKNEAEHDHARRWFHFWRS